MIFGKADLLLRIAYHRIMENIAVMEHDDKTGSVGFERGTAKAYDRAFFASLLVRSLSDISRKSGSRQVLASALGHKIREHLRIELRDPCASLDGPFFGPFLFPETPREQYLTLKFRDFLRGFPELVDIRPGPSGDIVTALTLDEVVRKPKPAISNAAIPAEGVAPKVGAADDDLPVSFGVGTAIETLPSPPRGYLIVESVSVLQAVHALLGEKPPSRFLPQWESPVRWALKEFPSVLEWKMIYFMALERTQVANTEGFQSFLKSLGFVVVPLEVPATVLADLKERNVTRARINGDAAARLLEEIASRPQAPIIVISHAPEVFNKLSMILAKIHPDFVRLAGFPEMLSDAAEKLQLQGVKVFDLERDLGAFGTPLPRLPSLIRPAEFDPKSYV